MYSSTQFFFFFFFNDTATTEIYTLSLHDALPICRAATTASVPPTHRGSRTTRHGSPDITTTRWAWTPRSRTSTSAPRDRKSTRLNSSHLVISYAVFCLKKKTQDQTKCTSDGSSY